MDAVSVEEVVPQKIDSGNKPKLKEKAREKLERYFVDRAVKELPQEISTTSVQEAETTIENISLWRKSRALLTAGKDKAGEYAKEFAPGIAASVGTLALEHFANMSIDSDGAKLIATVGLGAAFGLDGRTLASDLKNPNQERITKSVAIAFI